MNQEVHRIIQVSLSTPSFMFSAIYTKKFTQLYQVLWKNIIKVFEIVVGPWLAGGDFNDVTHSTKQFRGLLFNKTTCKLHA